MTCIAASGALESVDSSNSSHTGNWFCVTQGGDSKWRLTNQLMWPLDTHSRVGAWSGEPDPEQDGQDNSDTARCLVYSWSVAVGNWPLSC